MSDTCRTKPKVAFLHVPKCGGVSVESQLKKCFAPSEVAPLYFPHEYKEVKDKAKLQSYSLVIGHFDHDVLELLGPAYVKAILFREPLARAVSLYNHAASRQKHALHETIARGEMPFVKFCKLGSTRNTLSKYLLGRGNFARTAAERPLNVAIRNVVELANEHLGHFDCVGMLYEMERFHKLLSDVTGMHLEPFKKTNSSPSTVCVDSLTPEESTAFEATNVFDIEVYQAIRTYYERARISGQEQVLNRNLA